MAQRNFLNRGPTLDQLARATQAERARKAAATAQALGQSAQVNTANTAQANSVTTEAAAKQAQPKSAVIGTDARGRQIVANTPRANTGSLQAAQQIQAQNKPAQTVSTAQPAQTAQKSGFAAPGRQSRQGPVSGGKWTVQGKTLSQSQAEEDMARASALQNASVNNNIIGGSDQIRGGNTSYYDVDASLNDIYKQAQAAGVSISRPKTYGKTVSDSGQAQSILNAYVKSANDAIAAKSKSSSVSGSSGAYFDVDSSLNSVYNQAKSAGVTIDKPKTYGKSVTSERQAQSIIDAYVKTANDAISAKSKSSASASGGSGEYYDVDASLNSIYNQAKAAGVNVSKPTAYGKSVTTSAAAKAAYDEYYNYVDREYNTFNANSTSNARKQAIKNSIDDADRALTHADREEMAKWNRENKNMYDINKTINPAYMYWLKHGSSGTAAPPKYYEDAINEDYDKWASRDSANAARESQVAASQAKLQASYDAVQKNPGTTHAKNSKVVIANQKAVSKAPSPVTSSPTNKKLTVISAADSKKVQVAQTAARKAEVKSANESAAKAKSVASDAKNESAAYNKAILQKQAEIKKTANPAAKSALKSELKSLQKEANDSKKRADTADAAAKAAVNYSKAASALAVAPIASKSEAVAVKKLNTAASKLDKTSAAALKAGVQDHAGQILLKDGTWLDQHKVIGAHDKGEKSVKIFGTTKEYQTLLAEDYKNKLAGKSTRYRENPEYQVALDAKVAEIKELQAIRDAYSPVVGKDGKIYDAVQKGGVRGVGEAGVTVYRENSAGKIIARSRTAGEYAEAMKQATATAAYVITPDTAASDKAVILEARKYVLDRQTTVNRKPLKEMYASVDAGMVSPKTAAGFEPFAQEKAVLNQLKNMGKWGVDSTVQNVAETTGKLARGIAGISPITSKAVGVVGAAYGTASSVFAVKPGSRADRMRNDGVGFGDSAMLLARSPLDVYRAGKTERDRLKAAASNALYNNVIANDVKKLSGLAVQTYTPKTGSLAAKNIEQYNTLKEKLAVKPNSQAARISRSLHDGNVADKLIDSGITIGTAVPRAMYQETAETGSWIVNSRLATGTRELIRAKPGSNAERVARDIENFKKDPANNIIVNEILKDAGALGYAYTMKPGSIGEKHQLYLRDKKDELVQTFTTKPGTIGDYHQKYLRQKKADIIELSRPKPGSEAMRVARDIENFKKDPASNIVVSHTLGALNAIKETFTPKPGSDAERVNKMIANTDIPRSAIYVGSNALAAANQYSRNQGTSFRTLTMTPYMRKHGGDKVFDEVSRIAKESRYLSGIAGVVQGEINRFEAAPVTYTGELAAMYYGGKALGVATEFGIGAIEKGAAKAAISTAARRKVVTEGLAATTARVNKATQSIRASRNLSAAEKARLIAQNKLTLGKAAASTGLKSLPNKAAVATAHYVRHATMGVMTLSLAKAGYDTAKMNDLEKDIQFLKSIAIGGKGFSSGMAAGKGPLVDLVPGVKSYNLGEIRGGSRSTTRPHRVGETFSIGGKQIAVRDYKGLRRGSKLPEADVTRFKDLDVQPMNKEDIPVFEALVERMDSEGMARLKTGLKLTTEAYQAPRTPVTPKTFDVVSQHVPETARPVVKDVIQDYGKISSTRDLVDAARGYDKIQVYGSSTQPAQMGPYFTRKPGDLEVEVTNVLSFVQNVSKGLTKSGYKEGKDFRIMAGEKPVMSSNSAVIRVADSPKIEFMQDGKWEKGIEVFSSKAEMRSNEDMVDIAEGFSPIDGIPYGFPLMKSMKVDQIKIMKLQEQAAHKFEGANVLKRGKLDAKHEGRRKDARDLIEQMVGNYREVGTHSKSDIIAYVREVGKHDQAVVKKSKNPDEAKIFSPVASHIYNTGKIPTKAQIIKMTAEAPKREPVRDLIHRGGKANEFSQFKKVVKSTSTATPRAKQSIGSTRKAKEELSGKPSSSSTSTRVLKGSSSLSTSRSKPRASMSKGSSSSVKSSWSGSTSLNASGSMSIGRSMLSGSLSQLSASVKILESISNGSLHSIGRIHSKQIPSSGSKRQTSGSRPSVSITGSKPSTSGSSSTHFSSGSQPSRSSSSSKPSISNSVASRSSSSSRSSRSVSSVSSSSNSGSSRRSRSSVYIIEDKSVPGKKKKQKDENIRKRAIARLNLTRDIKNRLGGLESMFDVGTKSQATRKSKPVTSTKTSKPRAAKLKQSRVFTL